MPAMACSPVTICRAMSGVTFSLGTSDQVNLRTSLVGMRGIVPEGRLERPWPPTENEVMSPFDPGAHPLPIIVAGDPRLRQRSAEVEAVDHALLLEASRLIATLRDFKERSGFGRAISSVQVGVMKRLVALNLGGGPFVLLNPEISWRSEETFLVWDD